LERPGELLGDEPLPSLAGAPHDGINLAWPQSKAYLEHLPVGLPLGSMPLFLNPDRYVRVPLESTKNCAYLSPVPPGM
jgi:hypothetical protein